MTALRDLAAKLRNIDPHVHAIVKRRRRGGDDDDAVVGYDVYFSAARLINDALADGAFDSPAFQSYRPGPSALATLAEWLERNGWPVFDADIVRADRLAAALERFAAAEHQSTTETELVLSTTDLEILEFLANARTAVLQVELDANCIVSKRTASRQLKRLRCAGLTHRPNGPRLGEAITPAGRKKIAHCLPLICPQAPKKKEG